MAIYLYNGLPLVKNGALAISQGCCCVVNDCPGCLPDTTMPPRWLIHTFTVANLGCEHCEDANAIDNRILTPIPSGCDYAGPWFTICQDVNPEAPEGRWVLHYDELQDAWFLSCLDTVGGVFKHEGKLDCNGSNDFTRSEFGSECDWPNVLTISPLPAAE